MSVGYRIVDVEGDPIDLSLFTPGIPLPVEMRSVCVIPKRTWLGRLVHELEITLEYLHTKER